MYNDVVKNEDVNFFCQCKSFDVQITVLNLYEYQYSSTTETTTVVKEHIVKEANEQVKTIHIHGAPGSTYNFYQF